MNTLRTFLMLVAVLFSMGANALIIKDVISFNKKMAESVFYNFDFDLTRHGYNPLTDSITRVQLSYDFSELIDDGHDPDNMDTWESAMFYSRLFDGRSYDPDVTPGVGSERLAWTKTGECQLVNDDDICVYNLDLYGNARETVVAYTDNLWLGDVMFSVEVDRVNLPEPSSIIMLVFGLVIVGWRWLVHASLYKRGF